MKKRVTVTLEGELLEWVETQIKNKRFHNYQHALEYFLSEGYKKEFIRFEHFNVYEDHVTIWDHLKNRLIDINFRGYEPWVFCSLCEEYDCEHIRFALKLPKVVRTLRDFLVVFPIKNA